LRTGQLIFLALAVMPTMAHAEDLPTTRPALDSAVASRFADVDTDHDGTIDRREAAAALGVAAPPRQRRPDVQALFNLETGPDGRPRLSLNEDGPLSSRGMFDMVFAQIDRNGDGRLSQPEALAAARARFDAADRNHDGTLSRAEVEAARGQLDLLQRSLSGAR
jgi:hypothetical protein